MTTYPLFSSSDELALQEKLSLYFENWVAYRRSSTSRARAHRALNDDSAEVYQEMWNAFAAFCIRRSLDLYEIRVEDLELFLATRGTDPESAPPAAPNAELTSRYARRFLTLIDWVTVHQARVDGQVPNQAARELLERPEYRYANASDKDPLPEYLTDAQAKRLIAFVTQPADKGPNGAPEKWNVIRNRTAVALMLGGGLTPGDVRNLKMDGIHLDGGKKAGVPWKLSLPGNGNFPARETPLASWAGKQLAYWLKVREEQGISGDFVFPSRRSGGQWSDTRCYEMTREVLELAGLSNVEGGLFKLRHTFALRQLARGRDEKDVARWLGLLDINGMAKYRRVLPAPVEVV